MSSPITTTLPTATEALQVRSRTIGYFGLVLSTVRYLMRTEVHTFAFSVAANAILSFFPFVLLLMTLIRRVFHSPVMYEVVLQLLRDYLPAGQDFVIRNLNALVGARHQAVMDGQFVRDILTCARRLDWVDVTDHVGDSNVRRREFLDVSLVRSQPGNRCFITQP